MAFKVHKVVSALPTPLEADAVYLVRVGDGFDMFATDATGSIAHALNLPSESGSSQVFPEISDKITGLAIPYAQLSAGGVAWFSDIGARGIRAVRTDAYWDQIQTAQGGAYNWTGLDAVVDGLRAAGVHVLLVPSNKPAWGSSALTAIADRDAYAAFCGDLADRYRGRCDSFEVMNEPNKTAITGAVYADTLKRAYVAIKAANPAAQVITGGLAPVETTQPGMTGVQDWLDGFYSVQNVGAYYDQFGFHPYGLPRWPSDAESANTGWGWLTSIIRERMVAEGDGDKPVNVTEVGYVSDGPAAFDGAQGQADAVQEVVAALAALPWVSGLFIYSYQDIGGATTSDENWFGMIDPDGVDKPLAGVVQAAAQGGYAGPVSLAGESYTTAEKNKLAGIATGATANATDAQLRDRSTHTGTQPISSVTGLQAALDAKLPVSGYRVLGVAGNYVSQINPSLVLSNSTMVANRLRMAAFGFDRNITIDQVGLRIGTASTGLARIYIYERTEYDRMILVAQSGDIDTGATGYVSQSLPFTFQAGVVYLAGAVFSGTPSVNAVGANQSLLSLGMTSPTQTGQSGAVQINVNFGTAPPADTNLLGYSANGISAAVIMRIA